MKRSEIHDAAKAFVTNHARYIQEWYSRWEHVCKPFFQTESCAHTDGPPHPDWDKHSPEEIVDFFNDFWMSLPDNPGIRGSGFGALCDIAEHVFGFDDEDDSTPPENETDHPTETRNLDAHPTVSLQ